MDATDNRQKQAKKVIFLGMIINISLVIFKYLMGVFGRSQALIADAVHSASDLVSDVIVFIGFRFTSKPADEKHNYGHGKVETIAAVLIGVSLILLSVTLLRESATTIYGFFFRGEEIPVPKLYALIAVIASIVLKEILFRITKGVGDKIKSDALIASAWHHRSDALSSVAAFFGILVAVIFGERFAFFDPLASLIVSLLIFKVGISTLLANYHQLLESSLSKEEIKKVEGMINSIKEIKGFHNIKTRKIGFYIAIDVHIFVEKHLNVEEAHDITLELENKIYEEYGKESFVSIHVEPFYKNYPNKD